MLEAILKRVTDPAQEHDLSQYLPGDGRMMVTGWEVVDHPPAKVYFDKAGHYVLVIAKAPERPKVWIHHTTEHLLEIAHDHLEESVFTVIIAAIAR